jgi:hypothetical protein
MRKIKNFFWGLIFPKDLWLTESPDLIIPVGPTGWGKKNSHSLQLHKTSQHENAPIPMDILQYTFPLCNIWTSCL